jgi:dolichol-phosphate mannosyltransferase
VQAALHVGPEVSGESFNIGSGVKTTLASLANLSWQLFGTVDPPQFSSAAGRAWDVDDWYANPEKASRMLAWTAKVDLAEGLSRSLAWWKGRLVHAGLAVLTKSGSM